MKEYDGVRLIVEKEQYAKHGVHKGMRGWICDGAFVNGTWLVSFDEPGYFDEDPTISVKETDLEVIYESKTEEGHEGIR